MDMEILCGFKHHLHVQLQTPIIGDLTPIPVLTNLLSPSTPTKRLRREPTRGSRPLPPALNPPITDPSPPVSLQIDLPEATIDLASADVLTSTRLQPPPPPTVPAPPPSPPDIFLPVSSTQTIHAPPSVPPGISTTPRLSSSEPAAQTQTTTSMPSLRKTSHTAARPTRKIQKPPYLKEFHSGSLSDNNPTASVIMKNLTSKIIGRFKSNE